MTARIRRFAGLLRLQRDLIAQTVNEQLDDLCSRTDAFRAPYSSSRIAAAGGYTVSDFDGEPLQEHRRSPHGGVRHGVQRVKDQEVERVASLYASGLFERPVTKSLERLPRMAREHFGVMGAGCTLITKDTLITKSFTDAPVTVVPRQGTFCDHTIRFDRTFVLPDTHEDPRFKDSSIVTGPPFIRFYAGHPIQGPGGARIGALCVIDDRPRSFSTDDEHKLKTLAALMQLEVWAPAA